MVRKGRAAERGAGLVSAWNQQLPESGGTVQYHIYDAFFGQRFGSIILRRKRTTFANV